MTSRRLFIPSVFFAAMILLPLLAMLVLQTAQAYIKTNREEALENKELVQVVIPAKNLMWEEEGKELWVGDRMFDVASYSIINGNVHLNGVYDDDETRVAGALLHLVFSKNGNDLLQLILLLQCFTIFAFTLHFLAKRLMKNEWSPFFEHRYTNPFYLVLGPPPRL